MAGKLRSIRIEVAANGYTVNCDHEPEPSKKDTPCCGPSEKPSVFESTDSVLAYVKQQLNGGQKYGKAPKVVGTRARYQQAEKEESHA